MSSFDLSSASASRPGGGPESTNPLQLLANATSALLAVPELKHVLPTVLHLASRLIAADGYGIWRTQANKRSWSMVASRGLSSAFASYIDEDTALEMPKTPLVATDVSKFPVLASRMPEYEREGIRSLLAIPLLFSNQALGTICFYFRSVREFSPIEVQYASALGTIASGVISAAELYEAQQEERRRSEFLANAGAVLASSLDYQQTIQKVAELAVPAIADWCSVHTFFNGVVERVAFAHQDPAKLKFAADLQRRYPERHGPGSAFDRMHQTGESEFFPIVPQDLLEAAAVDEEHLRLINTLGLKSAIAVPVRTRNHIIGMLRLFSAESGRTFTDRDLALAEDLGRRAGTAIENARLHRALQMKQSEQRLVLDALPSLVAFVDRQQRFQFVNQAYSNWFGAGSQLIGMTIRELIGDTAYEKVRGYIEAALNGEQVTYEEELPFIHGGKRVVRAVYLPNREPSGEIRGYVAFISDVTQEHEASAAIRRSEERFRGVFNNATVPMCIGTDEGLIVQVNEAFCRLTGYTADELRTLHFADITHPDDVAHNLHYFQSLVRGDHPQFSLEKRYVRKDGVAVWARLGVSRLQDADGRTQIIVIAEDTTARKHAERESERLMNELTTEQAQLRAAVEQLKLVEQAVEAGTWTTDLNTRMQHWPPNMSALWGLPRQQHTFSIDDVLLRIHPEDRERVNFQMNDAMRQSGTYEVEFRVVWPDNSIHWLTARGALIRDEAGRPVQTVGITLESTRRKQTEEALLQSEKLAATGRLAATIAHEINNPLEAITNLLYLAMADPTASQSVRDHLSQADQELGRVAHIARQTLGFYKETTRPQVLALSDVVNQVLAFYARKIESKGITCSRRLDPEARVRAVQGELRQVLANFVLNAADALPTGGAIMATVRRRRNGQIVQLRIADNGHGIAKEHRAKLFEPFFTTKRDVGTGLGLWVSKGILEKYGATVRVRTRTGGSRTCSTVFSIEFPAASSE